MSLGPTAARDDDTKRNKQKFCVPKSKPRQTATLETKQKGRPIKCQAMCSCRLQGETSLLQHAEGGSRTNDRGHCKGSKSLSAGALSTGREGGRFIADDDDKGASVFEVAALLACVDDEPSLRRVGKPPKGASMLAHRTVGYRSSLWILARTNKGRRAWW